MKKNIGHILDVVITLISGLVAFAIYDNSLINSDVAWHVEGAHRLLVGGNYLTNVLDNNSPFVFLFFAPVVWLHEIISLSFINIINLYLLSFAFFILFLCHHLINKIYHEVVVKKLIYYTLVFSLLFLPQASFGQREIILIYLFIPYFFIVLHACIPKTSKLSSSFYYLGSLLAVIGIMQNLFYIFLPLILDCYQYLKTKKFQGYQFLFYVGLLLSLIIIQLFYPEYFQNIIPQTLCFESGFNFPLTFLFTEILAFISTLCAVLFLFQYKKYQRMNDIALTLAIVLLSFLIYLFERKVWFYHFYPTLTFTMLLLALVLSKYYEEVFLNKPHNLGVNIFTISFCITMSSTIIFIIIVYLRADIIYFHDRNNETNRWLSYAQQHFQNKKLFFFVIRLEPSYTLPIYTNAIIVSPWSNPWFLPYIIKSHPTVQQTNNPKEKLIVSEVNKKLWCNLSSDLKIFYEITKRSIQTNQPDFIIVENLKQRLLYLNNQFNYLDFFSQDSEIKLLLNNYQYFATIADFVILKKKPALLDKME